MAKDIGLILIVVCIILFALLGPDACHRLANSKDKKVFTPNNKLQYTIKGNKVFDPQNHLEYKIQGGKILDNQNQVKGYIIGDKIFDKNFHLTDKIDGGNILNESNRLKYRFENEDKNLKNGQK